MPVGVGRLVGVDRKWTGLATRPDGRLKLVTSLVVVVGVVDIRVAVVIVLSPYGRSRVDRCLAVVTRRRRSEIYIQIPYCQNSFIMSSDRSLNYDYQFLNILNSDI